jgi:hypothetical protein
MPAFSIAGRNLNPGGAPSAAKAVEKQSSAQGPQLL